MTKEKHASGQSPDAQAIFCRRRQQPSPSLSWRSMPVASWPAPARHGVTRRQGAATEQKYPVPLEYAKASFERIKQRVRHLWALARVKRALNDYTLAGDLDRQFGDLPVG
jgi:hypothetical protein